MTEYPHGQLVRGTTADYVSLMSHPMALRRGRLELRKPTAPAAAANFAYQVQSTFYERILMLLATFTTSAVAGNRSLAINYLDGDGTLFNQVPVSQLIGPSVAVLVSGDLDGTPTLGTGASVSATGTATAPAAGATIASAALPAGAYTVSWELGLSGTPGAADADNLQLLVGAAVVATSENGGAAGNWPQPTVQIQVPAGGATVALKTVGAGVAGSVYTATFTATLTNTLAAYPQLPDCILKPLWQVQLVITGAQAGDQISGPVVYTERYSSEYASGALATDLELDLELAER